ncbi:MULTISPECIES: YtxH domain-containing protein [unclassified Romboutsia]|uniref:YtxH domain-containing protein n=1 Tax=unclassified Romboutsia TaxID=2626894 RepID=UPI00082035AC|nr:MULTISPECIES: YtxH domain-containing protein [unclassified Romboutsia]SCI28616.1 Gas vesicle protein [uncultured Clostridium sp.]
MSRKRGKYLFLGAIIGFIAGLFFAPKKGSELRKEVKEKFDEVKDNPKDVLHETLEDVKEKISLLTDDCDEDNIKISEEEIIISRTFNDEGDNK